ncbi:MAG: mechanosensitive ion channel family protein [candidate division KSB1 bacterium]|nr:mechanosensitive ion channel family protein [candidate division KSB1 bacterium]MDZ7364582.1 mechanosensitive ion channel family protein [candidate division KSB1 bacterium]MDZ7402670.1 mechanosensitive ion channel family protein [candidate division KSB1 bacterium]
MDSLNNFFKFDWIKFALPLGVLTVTVIVGWIVKRLLFRALRRGAEKTKTRVDDILIQAFSGPFMIWMLILGLHLATQFSELSDRVTGLIGKSLLILWVISLTIVAARLAGSLVKKYGGEVQGALPVTSLTQNLARIGVVLIGILILLNLFGISITPLLTALGVGGLAVALALQDTLSNLFAGFYISLSGNVRPGDYIKLNSGEEGYVTDITWRSTAIRALQNNLIIVPNSKLAQAIVTNYYFPEKRMSLRIPIGVSYDSDPEQVERILIEEAQTGARDIPGLLAEPAPVVRFLPGFGESSLNFTLVCQVGEFADQFVVQHELHKRIFKRFREEGIEIPFPIRTVYLRDQAVNSKMKVSQDGEPPANMSTNL